MEKGTELLQHNVNQPVLVWLKNSIILFGTLKEVDQYFNMTIENTQLIMNGQSQVKGSVRVNGKQIQSIRLNENAVKSITEVITKQQQQKAAQIAIAAQAPKVSKFSLKSNNE